MSRWKTDRRIVYGVSGGIAAYKAPLVVRGWAKAKCDVETILTEAAETLVSPLALSTLTNRRVWRERDFLSVECGWEIPHITLADWAEVVVVAPCTANVLRLAAQGDSATLLGATLLATRAPVVLFPAMNVHMWEHATTQANVEKARTLGYEVVRPEEGFLACNTSGTGRMPDPPVIWEYVWKALYPADKRSSLAGKTVLVTAGPTREYLDPVRFISNPSSGRMGYAMARDAWRRGAENVILVTGPVEIPPPPCAEVVHVESAAQMMEECLKRSERADFIVKAAAVGDYRAAQPRDQKLKRAENGGANLWLELAENPDIVRELGSRKPQGQVIIGFAAETQDLEENARRKIAAKNLDFIVANDVSAEDAGFGVETNRVKIFSSAAGLAGELEGTKEEVAEGIWDRILGR